MKYALEVVKLLIIWQILRKSSKVTALHNHQGFAHTFTVIERGFEFEGQHPSRTSLLSSTYEYVQFVQLQANQPRRL